MTSRFNQEKSVEAARIELQRAQIVMEHNLGEALGHLEEGRRLDPSNVEIVMNLARIEVRLAHYSDAIDSLQRVLTLGETSEEILALLALCYLRLRRFEKAAAQSLRALALNGENWIAKEVLADCLRAQGAWSEAEKEIRGLLKESEGLSMGVRARLNLKLAQCLLRLGAHAQAWEITHSLLRSGYADAQLKAVHRESEALNKAEILEAFGKPGFFQRIVLWMADRQILRAVSLGRRRGMAAQAKYLTVSSEDSKKGEDS